MCKFCENSNCTLTKQQALEHGAIIEDNVYHIMRVATDSTPNTYSFKDMPCYDSLSALFPHESDENPHAYERFIYDEDENCSKDWEYCEVQNPLSWNTEEEFIKIMGVN
ncbi:hypothetical protein [Anaerosporobacter faecicola]|uniref:hypothetical protein n=1 Tax=Anaerosporobacter faecicola TaxID=2718714 RepID=UPI0014397204|nr:hypothetical protein [Anaerosporobacter faecicola]